MKEAASNRGFTIWFTGLPCAGKTTLANLVAAELQKRGRGVEILDGDAVRTHLSKGLGFSREDRDENIRRIGFVCGLLSKHGAIAIAAAVSPFRATRDQVRATIENFVEVYVAAPLEVCIARDVKGMYKKAMAGEIPQFTGISDPYEHPLNPELTVEAYQESPEASAARIIAKLEQMGLVEPAGERGYTPEEAGKIHARLVDLGYIEP
jgi:adenylyl-sulfate kinase